MHGTPQSQCTTTTTTTTTTLGNQAQGQPSVSPIMPLPPPTAPLRDRTPACSSVSCQVDNDYNAGRESASASASATNVSNGNGLPPGARCAQDTQDEACSSWISPADRSRLRTMTADAPSAGAMLHKHIKRLPPGSRPVKLVGEGAANAVFEMKVPRGKASDADFKGMILTIFRMPHIEIFIC